MPQAGALDETGKNLDGNTAEKPDVSKEEAGTDASTGTIKVGDRELSHDEIVKLVEKAERVNQIEEKQNIDVDKLYGDYVRKSQLLKDYEKRVEGVNLAVGGKGATSPEEESERLAVEELRKKYNFLTADDREVIKKEIKADLQAESILGDLKEIEKDYPGLKRDEVLDFMTATKNSDPFTAAEKLDAYKKAANGELPKAKKPVFTEKSGSAGVHVPKGKDIPSLNKTQELSDFIKEELEASHNQEE